MKAISKFKKIFKSDADAKIFISLLMPFLYCLTFCMALASLIITSTTLNHQIKFMEDQKQSDMTFRFQQRYQNVITELKYKLENGEVNVNDYLYDYWAIQYDQFVMNKHNNLLHECFDIWMIYRYNEYIINEPIKYKENDSVKYIKYRDGFDKTIKLFYSSEFEKFFRNVVFKGKYKRENN